MGAKVMNTSPKIIGLGGLIIQPNEIVDLPEDFGLEHPTVAFFVNRGWLTKVPAGGAVVPPATNVDDTPPETEGGGDKKPYEADAKNEAKEKEAAEYESAKDSISMAEKVKSLGKMNKEELRAEAAKLGVTYASNAGDDLIRQRIADKYREGQE